MRVISLKEIKESLPAVNLIDEIEQGFVAYSRGKSVVPPVGELILEDPPGEVHIKYGYIKGDDYYVIKIASGFYDNRNLGLPAGNGMMLLFSQRTGEPIAILHDEAYLTDIRTAVAGTISAKYLAPEHVSRIGIAGTGNQARLQLEYLKPATDCRKVLLWGRDPAKYDAYIDDMTSHGFEIETTTDASDLLANCNLIVTTTTAARPVLVGEARAGTHITAMGSDTPEKQELDAAILAAADLVVADSIPQCLERGEIHQALKVDAVRREQIIELGSIVAGDAPGRTSDDQVTIADLTGVAVQDIQISKAVCEALGLKGSEPGSDPI
jgi:ornithine cyclodeaminase